MDNIAKHGSNSIRLIHADTMVRHAKLEGEETSRSVERRQAAGCGTTQVMPAKIGSGITSFSSQESLWDNSSN